MSIYQFEELNSLQASLRYSIISSSPTSLSLQVYIGSSVPKRFPNEEKVPNEAKRFPTDENPLQTLPASKYVLKLIPWRNFLVSMVHSKHDLAHNESQWRIEFDEDVELMLQHEAYDQADIRMFGRAELSVALHQPTTAFALEGPRSR